MITYIVFNSLGPKIDEYYELIKNKTDEEIFHDMKDYIVSLLKNCSFYCIEILDNIKSASSKMYNKLYANYKSNPKIINMVLDSINNYFKQYQTNGNSGISDFVNKLVENYLMDTSHGSKEL